MNKTKDTSGKVQLDSVWVQKGLDDLMEFIKTIPKDKVVLIGYVDENDIIQRFDYKAIQKQLTKAYQEGFKAGCTKVLDDVVAKMKNKLKESEQVVNTKEK